MEKDDKPKDAPSLRDVASKIRESCVCWIMFGTIHKSTFEKYIEWIDSARECNRVEVQKVVEAMRTYAEYVANHGEGKLFGVDSKKTTFDYREVADAIAMYANEVERALGKPPRNCDSMTLAEQNAAYDAFCHDRCGECPLRTQKIGMSCFLGGSQLPYQGKSAKCSDYTLEEAEAALRVREAE